MRGASLLLAVGLAVTVASIAISGVVPAARGAGSELPLAPAFARPYTVTFAESGLPSGTTWSVHIAYLGCGCEGVATTVRSTSPSIGIAVSNGSYKFTVLAVSGYFVNGSAHGTFNVSGSNVPPIPVGFLPVFSYGVGFNETGLPNGTAWTVSVTGNGTGQLRAIESQTETTVESSMAFLLPNGSYRFVVTPVPGSFFGPHSASGRFAVAGAAASPIAITFVTPPTYAVDFFEVGLALGSNWTVAVTGFSTVPIHEVRSSTSSNVTFLLPTGSYHYAVAEVLGFVLVGPTTGSFAVAAVPLAINLTFAAVAPGAFYAVAFQESGLAPGTHWSVEVVATLTFGHSRSAVQSANGSTLFFLLQNGTYRFVVHPLQEYSLVGGGSGAFGIHGSAPGVQLVQFAAKPTYTVTFTESGLPSGTNWTVLVRTEFAGSSLWPVREVHRGNTSSITFGLPNGSYCFTIYGVPGYYVSSGFPAGPFSVAGASPPPITVGFSPRA